MTAIADRKKEELAQKVQGVCDDFKAWRSLSEPRAELEKHHTQIKRMTAQLESMASEVSNELGGVDDYASVRKVELMVLELHRLWDFFRSKLVQRFVAHYKPHLRVADEFAWACYQPAQAAGLPSLQDPASIKEPPLLFLNGSLSPFTLPRGFRFQAEHLLYSGALPVNLFEDVANRLPVSVIGIPWSQVQHVPDMVVIGHEVGHAVIRDLEMRDDVRQLVSDAVSADRSQAWANWSEELFCDWFGTLALGPAFLAGLIDFLVMYDPSPGSQQRSSGNWGLYPTDPLRVASGLAMLRRLCFGSEAEALRLEWQAICPEHSMECFEEDVDGVVCALADGRLSGLSGTRMSDAFRFTREDHNEADKAAEDLLAKRKITAASVRQLIAAGRLAFARDPVTFRALNGNKRVRSAIEAQIATGVRAGLGNPSDLGDPDRAAGRSLVLRIQEFAESSMP